MYIGPNSDYTEDSKSLEISAFNWNLLWRGSSEVSYFRYGVEFHWTGSDVFHYFISYFLRLVICDN